MFDHYNFYYLLLVSRALHLSTLEIAPPKVYGFIDDNGKEIIKIKGVTNEIVKNISLNDLESLLIKDSTREFTQEKWYTSIINGEITTLDTIYTLKITSNKRKAIYIDEIFSETLPYFYDEL
jgi:hypothetical protein